MPWEWKDDGRPPPVPPVSYQRPYASVSELKTLTWLAVLFSLMITIAFGLLVGFARDSYDVTTDGTLVYYSLSSNGGYSAGIALMVIGSIASLVVGIIMLVRTWTPALVNERGMIVAMGVITILGGLIFVGIILGLVLLSRLSGYGHSPAQRTPPPPPPPPVV